MMNMIIMCCEHVPIKNIYMELTLESEGMYSANYTAALSEIGIHCFSIYP